MINPNRRDKMNQTHSYKIGDQVLKDGHKGTIIEVCDWADDLVVVRLESGDACVSTKWLITVEG